MQVGLFLDMRNPPQWERPWAAFYGDALDRIVEAEQLGIDSVWLTEHHFFEDGYLPQPLTFAAAIAGFALLLLVAVRLARNISIFGEESVRPPH